MNLKAVKQYNVLPTSRTLFDYQSFYLRNCETLEKGKRFEYEAAMILNATLWSDVSIDFRRELYGDSSKKVNVRDIGVDLIKLENGVIYLYQCKNYSEGSRHGINVISRLTHISAVISRSIGINTVPILVLSQNTSICENTPGSDMIKVVNINNEEISSYIEELKCSNMEETISTPLLRKNDISDNKYLYCECLII